MNPNPISQTATGMQMVFKATMELYEGYFQALEAALNATPDSDMQRVTKLRDLVQEAEEALEHDLGIFEKAVSLDAEGLNNMQDELKIASIHKQLQNG
jgi:hypothetical protein